MKAIKSIIITLLLLATARLSHGSVLKTSQDSLPARYKTALPSNEQYTISIFGNSDNLKWTAIRKWYYRNSDTILIFNQKSIQKPELILHKMTMLHFINQDLLLASGNGKSEFHNLKSKTRQTYDDVLQVAVLKIKGQDVLYAIMHTEGNLEICGLDSKVVHRLTGVRSLQTVENVGFIINHKESSIGHVSRVSHSGVERLYTSNAEISKLIFTDDQQYAIIDETIFKSDKTINLVEKRIDHRLTMINLENGKVSQLSLDSSESFDEVEMTAIGKGGSYLLFLKKKVKPDNEMLEIWTGNESNISSLYKGRLIRKFYIWNSVKNVLTALTSDPEEMFIAFTNAKYLLKYHPHAGHNYVFHYPAIKMRLYDVASQTEKPLGTFSGVDQAHPETIYSRDGKFILASADRENWVLWNLETMSKTAIDGTKLKRPIYRKDGRSICFSSDNGLWKYDIQSQKLSQFEATAGTRATILNGEKIRQFNVYNFSSHEIDPAYPILYKTFDFDNNRTGYFLLRNGKPKPVIPMTENRIRDLIWSPSFDRFNFLEENYNFPTQLLTQENEDLKMRVYHSNDSDHLAKNLKKEIITYKNKEGVNLRGTLYYPFPFDPKRKYPMVVRIYQVQRYYANEYMIKGDASYVAYDKRGLVEKGYFVYEPDIIYGNEGTGRGALDCINHAMDAVQNNRSINFNKVALLGHSHGGYSTNFIATQSNRFATYISGAGNSDIVRSYFSYNRNFETPFYFQFESGQYEMPPFLQNKQMYFNNNPIHFAENVNAPILLWAGKKDENIFWEQVQEFYIGLKRNQKDVIALFYNKAGHDLGLNTAEKADMHRRSAEWLDYFLKDKKDVEWISKQMKNDF